MFVGIEACICNALSHELSARFVYTRVYMYTQKYVRCALLYTLGSCPCHAFECILCVCARGTHPFLHARSSSPSGMPLPLPQPIRPITQSLVILIHGKYAHFVRPFVWSSREPLEKFAAPVTDQCRGAEYENLTLVSLVDLVAWEAVRQGDDRKSFAQSHAVFVVCVSVLLRFGTWYICANFCTSFCFCGRATHVFVFHAHVHVLHNHVMPWHSRMLSSFIIAHRNCIRRRVQATYISGSTCAREYIPGHQHPPFCPPGQEQPAATWTPPLQPGRYGQDSGCAFQA